MAPCVTSPHPETDRLEAKKLRMCLHCPCGSLQRIRAWHDPVKDMCLSLAKQAGVNCSPEVSNHMLCSEKRPEIVLWGADGNANCLIDVITSDPTMPNVCPRGAVQTGAAAEVAALSKERAWTAFDFYSAS